MWMTQDLFACSVFTRWFPLYKIMFNNNNYQLLQAATKRTRKDVLQKMFNPSSGDIVEHPTMLDNDTWETPSKKVRSSKDRSSTILKYSGRESDRSVLESTPLASSTQIEITVDRNQKRIEVEVNSDCDSPSKNSKRIKRHKRYRTDTEKSSISSSSEDGSVNDNTNKRSNNVENNSESSSSGAEVTNSKTNVRKSLLNCVDSIKNSVTAIQRKFEAEFEQLERQMPYSRMQFEQNNSDYFLMHIPKSLHPQLLTDTKLSSIKKTKVFGEQGTYTCVFDDNGKQSSLHAVVATGDQLRLTQVCPIRNISVQRYLKLKCSTNAPEYAVPITKLPNIKIRHPLFGTDYDAKINLFKATTAKLDDATFTKSKVKHNKHFGKQKRHKSEEIFKYLDNFEEKRIKHMQLIEGKNMEFMDSRVDAKKQNKGVLSDNLSVEQCTPKKRSRKGKV